MRDREDEMLFDEGRLRRALRLEASEMPPRLDVALLAARARRERPALAAAALLSSVLAVVAAALALSFVALALPSVAPAFLSELLGTLLAAGAAAAVPVAERIAVAQQPSVPIALLAALTFAIAYENAQRKESRRDVRTS
jgi:hypothetical protein